MADESETLLGSRWLRRHIPTRHTVHQHRVLRPFARHLRDPALWRPTHRSVPRAVALGLGIGVIIPVPPHLRRGAVCNSAARQCRDRRCLHVGHQSADHSGALLCRVPHRPVGASPRWRGDESQCGRTGIREFSRALFWIHHASGPIALGIVIAIAAVLGYGFTAVDMAVLAGQQMAPAAARAAGGTVLNASRFSMAIGRREKRACRKAWSVARK